MLKLKGKGRVDGAKLLPVRCFALPRFDCIQRGKHMLFFWLGLGLVLPCLSAGPQLLQLSVLDQALYHDAGLELAHGHTNLQLVLGS